MSADNWAICPKCKKKAEEETTESTREARAAYGAKGEQEYRALLQRSQEPVAIQATLSEYFDIGIDRQGRFSINYSAGCETCGFKYDYRHEEQLSIA